MYQRTHSSMMSASNTRLRYIGSRAIGFVIRHLGQTKSGSLSDVPGCTRTPPSLGTITSLLRRLRRRRINPNCPGATLVDIAGTDAVRTCRADGLLAYSDGLILQIGYRESHVAANSGC